MSAMKRELDNFRVLIGVAAAGALDGLPGFPPDDIEPISEAIERAAMNVVMVHCGFWTRGNPDDLLRRLAQRVADLEPATRDNHPGIGAGMLNSLISDARHALAVEMATVPADSVELPFC